MTSLVVNLPEVVADLSASSDVYEQALVANDVDSLKAFFWNSPSAIRFGVTEELYGADAIAAFRVARKINFSARTTLRREVLTLGLDFGVVTIEFSVLVAGTLKHGRQTQVWTRLDAKRWCIVSAHISHKVQAAPTAEAQFADSAAAMVALTVDANYREGVAANIAIMRKIAQPLLDFTLPAGFEPAPEFKP